METIELTGFELYELIAQINGFKNEASSFVGLNNEKNVTQGTKRYASRIAKKIVDEIKTLNERRVEISEYKDESMSEEALKQHIIQKDTELMNDKIKLEIEKLDFSKVEDCILSENYTFLYDKIFK
jgi:hypothetical protein